MNPLFENAVTSIRLGVEDFSIDTPARSHSAARNFYAGALLLAKEVLRRKAPKADIEDILAAKYKPVPDGSGGVTVKPQGHTTIDFAQISERFKSFGIKFEQASIKRLEALGKLRNDIEHKFTTEPHDAVKAAIGKAFPTVLELFYLCEEDPHSHLGAEWQKMVKIKEAYDIEHAACIATFSKVDFLAGELDGDPFHCPNCDAELVVQVDPENTEPTEIEAKCRLCGNELKAEEAITAALANKYGAEMYEAATMGGDNPVDMCPDCSVEAYVDGVGCLWCSIKLGACNRCNVRLVPGNTSWDSNVLCDYCAHMMAKDD